MPSQTRTPWSQTTDSDREDGVSPGGDGFSELDVEVLRIVAFHERWQCLGEDGCAVDFTADADAPLSEAPRIAPPALRGDWKVFDVSAVPIEETDVETGARGNTASCRSPCSEDQSNPVAGCP